MHTKQTLAKTTPQQRRILYLLYAYRFLTTTQIQYFLHHKEPTRIQTWLKYLFDTGYIGRYEPDTTTVGNNEPYYYFLMSKAKYVLKDNENCDPYLLDRLYREKTIQKPFRKHCLSITDRAIQMEKEAIQNKQTINWFTQRELSGYLHFPQPLPDAYIEVKQPQKRTKRYFLELFDKQMPRFAMRARITRYFHCAESDEWEKQTHIAFPVIIILCHDLQTKRFLDRFIKRQEEEPYVMVSFQILTQDMTPLL